MNATPTPPPPPGWLCPQDLRTNRGGWHPPHAAVCPPASKQRRIQAPTELDVPRPDLPEHSEGRTQRIALIPPRCIGWGSICTPRLQTNKGILRSRGWSLTSKMGESMPLALSNTIDDLEVLPLRKGRSKDSALACKATVSAYPLQLYF